MAHSNEKVINKNYLQKKDLMAKLLDKDFKTTLLEMLKELKDNVEKTRKMLCEQNGNVIKEIL